jgi:serine/threonine protein kinase
MTECPTRDELAGLLNETCDAREHDRLEAHLGTCDHCQREILGIAVDGTEWDVWEQRLRSRRDSWPGGTIVLPDEPDPDDWPVVPGYELLGVLGRGGMGIVFKARQLTLSRLVALKTLPLAGPQQGELRKRLLGEAEALARLHHPHIVQIFEVLEADGYVVLALELIHGGSLAERLHDSTLSPAEAARMVELLARTMQVAHDAQILHRDLKPSNVMLTADGVPKITDFGLARRLEVAGETQTGHVIGTPSYVSPEQAQGLEGWSTPATDIYGLGAILYECLTGRPPFRGENSFETLRQVIQEEPPSPSRLQSNLPRDLVTICLKCLRKDPARRYHTCTELADDLQLFQVGRPILARRTSLWGRSVKWARRHPRVAVLSAALLLTLAVLLGLWADFTRRITRLNADLKVETRRANDGERTARKARDYAEAQRIVAENTLLQVSTVMRDSAAIVKTSPGAENRLTIALPPRAYARLLGLYRPAGLDHERSVGYHWLGRKLLEAGEPEEAAQYLWRAVQVRRGVELIQRRDPQRCLELGVFLSDYGSALFKTGKITEAEKAFRGAVAIFENPNSGTTDPDLHIEIQQAGTMLMLAAVLVAQDRRDEAREILKQALALQDRLPTDVRNDEASGVFKVIRRRLQMLQ